MTLTCPSRVSSVKSLVAEAVLTWIPRSAVAKPLPPKNVAPQDRQARAFDWNAGPSITPLSLGDVSNDLLAMGVSCYGTPAIGLSS